MLQQCCLTGSVFLRSFLPAECTGLTANCQTLTRFLQLAVDSTVSDDAGAEQKVGADLGPNRAPAAGRFHPSDSAQKVFIEGQLAIAIPQLEQNQQIGAVLLGIER